MNILFNWNINKYHLQCVSHHLRCNDQSTLRDSDEHDALTRHFRQFDHIRVTYFLYPDFRDTLYSLTLNTCMEPTQNQTISDVTTHKQGVYTTGILVAWKLRKTIKLTVLGTILQTAVVAQIHRMATTTAVTFCWVTHLHVQRKAVTAACDKINI